ncbi:interactor of constitutive active ROPs 3-like [Vicia villosa]|uniref:interactor of constitutive active ROPs 3-like n=1 Tax=Vicia villosa TaxID=3911 RepID=UPI00273BADC2|nr:interactor of constitutive active ROPs 3-like [Vicia villosa]XP_058753542.1 interactor of constitutive active ROPs 3-like [Vicia villosa]
MKHQLQDCKESVQAQPLVNETLRQLEAAKRTVEFLRADAAKAVHGYNSSALELDKSRTCVISHDSNLEIEEKRLRKGDSTNHIEIEFRSLRSEVEFLRSAIEIAETKFQEEQIQNTVKIRNAYELIERIKSEANQRESELKTKKAEIEELKEKLLDKENELQGIVDENEKLNSKLEKNVALSTKKERELKEELKRLDECVAVMKGEMMDKETTLQSISEENEILKMEINKRFTFSNVGMMSDEVAAEIGAAKAAERDAFAKLKIMIEEADRSNNKAARVTEMLEAAQAANTEKEAELKRIKVQCDQWRKAAETAAAMFSTGKNGNIAERSMSMDNNYNCSVMKSNKYSNFYEEIDDWSDLQRKKNGNVLKKIGDLWKKPQKITG